MKKNQLFKGFLAFALAGSCLAGLTGCGTDTSKKDDENSVDQGLTGGVAATVNGVEIEEDQITRYINSMRIRAERTDDDSWAEYLSMYGQTPESMRNDTLDQLIDQELVKQFAHERDAEATDEQIQGYIDDMRANYSSDEAWQTALEGAGFDDEQGYRDALFYSVSNKNLEEGFAEESQPTDEALLEAAQNQLAAGTTTRKSSHILFGTDDKETAESVLAQLQSGELDFAEAASEYSTDTGSAADGGNVGWDSENSFVEAYQTALDGLGVNEMTELVESDYGYHIIKCTDLFTVPEGGLTSTDGIPEDMMANIRTSVESTAADDAKTEWLKQKREESDVVINDMPENVPYNVDMSKYETEDEQEAIDEESEEELIDDVTETEEVVDEAALDGAEADAAAEADSSSSSSAATAE